MPFTREELALLGKNLKMLVANEYIAIASYRGEPSAMAVTLPNINDCLQGLGGRLLPFGWAKLAWNLLARPPRSVRMPLMGVLRKHHGTMVGSALAIPLVLSFAAFMLTYWLLPNRHQQFRFVWPGALLAALGFEALKVGFAAYVEHYASFSLIYGSLASVIVLLFWVFLSANIVIFGGAVAAEVAHVVHGEPTEGPVDWRRSLVVLLRGLVLAPDEE